MIEYSTLIANVGFPMASFLLMYHLVRTTLKENTKALLELKQVIQTCKKR